MITVEMIAQDTSVEEHALPEEPNSSKAVLMAMCIGLKSDEEPIRDLGDMTIEPYSSSKKKRSFSPKKCDLIKEVTRRYNCNPEAFQKKPRADNWSNAMLVDWLKSNPVDDNREVDCLKKEEKKFYEMLLAAEKELSGVSDINSGGGSRVDLEQRRGRETDSLFNHKIR